MIFRRSLVSELTSSAGGVFTVLFSIVLTVGLVRVLGQAVGGRIDPAAVFEMMVYSSMLNLPQLLTLSLFISVLMVLMRHWQDNEIVVWFSSGGLSLLHWIRPVLRFSIPVILLIALMSVVLSPWSRSQIERLSTEFEQRDDVNRITPGRFIEAGDGRVFFIEEVSEDGTKVKNVFMNERGKAGQEIVVKAQSGEIRVTGEGERFLTLHDGRRYAAAGKSDASWQVADFDRYELKLDIKADQSYGAEDVDEMTMVELLGVHTPRAYAELAWRLTWPLAALNLVLLAIPLSYCNPRAGRSMSLIIALLVFICYLNGVSLMRSWIRAQTMAPTLAFLVLNLSVTALVALLFVRRVWMQYWLPLWMVKGIQRLMGARK